MATQVIMPQLGESVVEGKVGSWLKAEGEDIQAYQPLLEVESDKVNTEIPAPASGILLKILVPAGTTVSAGTVLAIIGQPGEVEAGLVPAQPSALGAGLVPAPNADGQAPERPAGRGIITPVVARIAAEHSINLASADIRGSGRGGRITKKDILAYVERQSRRAGRKQVAPGDIPPWEQPGSGELFKPTEQVLNSEPSVPGPERSPLLEQSPAPGQTIPLTSMRRLIAEHMLRSLHTSAQATTVMEADMSRVVAYRERHAAEFQRREGLKLTLTPFFIQAVIEGLKAVPEANSSFSEQGILLHAHIHIGIAVALESGLVAPVIRNADQLSLSGLQRAVSDLATRARAGHLQPDELQGATFTLTNHGVSGSLFATPIINQPNAGILGVGAVHKRPVVVSAAGVDSIAIKPMAYLSFTFDHRILDGAHADRFLSRVVQVLERWGE